MHSLAWATTVQAESEADRNATRWYAAARAATARTSRIARHLRLIHDAATPRGVASLRDLDLEEPEAASSDLTDEVYAWRADVSVAAKRPGGLVDE